MPSTTRSARQIISKAGRWPLAAVVAGTLALPSAAWAQAADAPAVRDPMRAGGAQGGADAKNKVVVSDNMTVDLHVKDEDLANVLELLSIQTQKNIIASNKVGGKVTATLYSVTFYQALDAILHVNGFGYMENGNFIYVYTQEELKTINAANRKRVSKTIRLNYLNAEDAREFITPLLSRGENGGVGGEIKVSAKTKDFSMPDKAPVGKNDYALGDTLVVFDYEENVKAVEELVKQIDTRPQQVLVEATILQTSLNEANAFGVDFSIIGDLNFTDFINIGGPLGAANGLIKGGTGASGQGLSPADDQGYAGSTSVGNTSGPGGLKVGVVAGDLSIFLRVLDQVTDTTILSNPKILALNRQPARVLVGKRVGYLNTTQTETSTTQSVEFLDTGTQLYFRPFVSSEGEVRMELKPQVSSAEIRTVTDTGGRAVTIPDEITQELVTNVNVRDGQTIVLGGLFTENSTFTRRQVPIVGDIPILGAAFRGHDDSTVRSEIIFLITPTIVTDTLIAGAADKAAADIERVRAGTRQGLLPFSREKMTDTLNVEAEQLAREGKSDEALYKLNRSLSLNPFQPEAYRLREKITGEREGWQDQSMLNNYLDKEVSKRSDSIPAATGPTPDLKPKGSVRIPKVKVEQDGLMGAAEGAEPSRMTAAREEPAIPMPGQAEAGRYAGATFSTPENPLSAAMAAQMPAASAAPADNTFTTDPAGGTQVTVNGETYTVAPAGTPASNPTTVTATGGTVTIEAVAPGAMAPEKEPADQASAAPQQPAYVPPTLNDEEKKAVQHVTTALPGLRDAISMFSLMNAGQQPVLGGAEAGGWSDLVSGGIMQDLPANPYVGGPNATKIVLGESPDTAYHTNYGWVYNAKTGQLWAAGFDASNRPLSKTMMVSMPQNPAQAPAQPAVAQQPAPAAPQATEPAAPAPTPEPATAGVEPTDN